MDKGNKRNKLNIMMIVISAGMLVLLFVVNILPVLNVLSAKKENEVNTDVEEEVLQEITENEKDGQGEMVQAADECLDKYKGKIYVSAEKRHFFYVHSLHFQLFCDEHLAHTDDVTESYKNGGIYLCLHGDFDVCDFRHYIEDGKEYFINEEGYLKFVYDEEKEKWSIYTNSDNTTSVKGVPQGEWFLLREYYSQDSIQAASDAYEQEEKRKDNEKIEAMKNTVVKLQAGENTVTINPIEGYLPYSNKLKKEIRYSESKDNQSETVVVMGKADSYEDIYYDNYEILLGDYTEKVCNFRYSIKDKIEDTCAGYIKGDTYQYYMIDRIEGMDSAGNPITVLDITQCESWFTNQYEKRDLFIEVYNYANENGCTYKEAYTALGYEGEYNEPKYKAIDIQREYYKELENGQYLCLTIEDFDSYEEYFYVCSFMELEEAYGEIIYDDMEDIIASIPSSYEPFLKYLEDDCYTFE